ncbi:DUF4145 domain-containing protein [Treponema sp. OMZ 788]|uniref:DUF4145 domain-containing protein n=1 Tax=Treponema sp. OMZ 788 TaxID=2563664 RepID=UPI0020A5F08D|nr:DUF4145 domain-containing protein [Treponema sp. OMZ 788]UTC63023.1 DUF4145 domain-containing protein [Treponema sp. OMZ 787]UTC64141.1 DUF4145 domain-containing protein [Treponema sp. OMZ 788]
MIRDYWRIKNKTLAKEIDDLKNKIPNNQWRAINSLRKIGNIGAHMEKDVNIIIRIEYDEAKKMQKLIEYLLEKWYIARHNDEVLFSEIETISNSKKEQKNEKVILCRLLSMAGIITCLIKLKIIIFAEHT